MDSRTINTPGVLSEENSAPCIGIQFLKDDIDIEIKEEELEEFSEIISGSSTFVASEVENDLHSKLYEEEDSGSILKRELAISPSIVNAIKKESTIEYGSYCDFFTKHYLASFERESFNRPSDESDSCSTKNGNTHEPILTEALKQKSHSSEKFIPSPIDIQEETSTLKYGIQPERKSIIIVVNRLRKEVLRELRRNGFVNVDFEDPIYPPMGASIEKCSIDIRELTNLNRADARTFSCEFCKKNFSRKSSLSNHFIVHTGEKAFSCDKSHKKFRNKQNLTRHLLIHTGEKPFSCDICHKKFGQKIHLANHLLIHTGEKPFSCDFCHKRFRNKQNLTTHLLIHTGEKRFSCDVCHKKFGNKHNLARHLLIHTGETPFSCDICHKKFRQKNNLTLHLLIHTGETPFSCDVCHKKFREKMNLKKHLISHAGEKNILLSR